jgi:glycogen(starch) synthase
MPRTSADQSAEPLEATAAVKLGVLMLAASPIAGDVRILREAAALTEDGHWVTVIGKDVPPGFCSTGIARVLSGSGGHGLGGAPSRYRGPLAAARWLALPEHRRLVWRRWSREAARIAAELAFDVVHAHDFVALPLGHALAQARGVPLVYDAHELWSQRFRVGRPRPLARRQDLTREQQLGATAAAVITVGDGLAARLRHQFGWSNVHVVRNTFPPLTGPERETPPTPNEALYAGRLGPGRDLETVAAASRMTAFPIRLQGPVDANWTRHFHPGHCVVEPAQHPDVVTASMRRAGLVLVPLTDTCENHRVAMPNKLFQAVAAGVPVVAADVGALGELVRSRGIGVVYRPGNHDSLVAALRIATQRYDRLLTAVEDVAAEMDWAVDRLRLITIYRRIGP